MWAAFTVLVAAFIFALVSSLIILRVYDNLNRRLKALERIMAVVRISQNYKGPSTPISDLMREISQSVLGQKPPRAGNDKTPTPKRQAGGKDCNEKAN